jgi:transposase
MKELEDEIKSLRDLVAVLLLRISALESENISLRAENEELRSRLNLNSKNSHKPPSTDGLSKKPGLPKGPAKPSGGQVGHKGNTLRMVEKPDVVVLHHASSCPCCARAFVAGDVIGVSQKRQVFDIPAPRLEVTEHQLGLVSCCGQWHEGVFPAEVGQPAQYGTRIRALSVLLNNDYKLPFGKIGQLMRDLWGCSFNESTSVSANASMYDRLAPVEAQIRSSVQTSAVVHFDETGMRVKQKLHWFHVACTGLFTYLFVHAKRGKEALLCDDSPLRGFMNRAVHDCWASYFDFGDCEHSLCCAHLLRELANLVENGSKWADEMHGFFLKLYKESNKGTTVLADRPVWELEFKRLCQLADEEEPAPVQGPRGKPKNTKGRNLLNRLLQHKDGWIGFAFTEDIPFTNNQAERDIRCVKTKQKVATNFQTLKGAQNYARVQSFTSTLRKHSMNVFQNLVEVFEGNQISFRVEQGGA